MGNVISALLADRENPDPYSRPLLLTRVCPNNKIATIKTALVTCPAKRGSMSASTMSVFLRIWVVEGAAVGCIACP
jgi:hypothetical protein